MHFRRTFILAVALLAVRGGAVAQQNTPSAWASTTGRTSVLVTDSMLVNGRPVRIETSDGDRFDDSKFVPGQLALGTANSVASGSYTPPGGRPFNSSGAASSFGSAMADYGMLKAFAAGSGSGSQANNVISEAYSTAHFTDFIVLTGSSLVEVEFGFGLEGSVSAQPLGPPPVTQGTEGSRGSANAGAGLLWGVQNLRTQQSFNDNFGIGPQFTGSEPLSATVRIAGSPGDTILIVATLNAGGGVGMLQTGSADYLADASNTAETFIRVLTAGAGYVAASGMQYPTDFSWTTPIPEPGTYALLGLGLLAVMVRARSQPAERPPVTQVT